MRQAKECKVVSIKDDKLEKEYEERFSLTRKRMKNALFQIKSVELKYKKKLEAS